MSRTLIVVGTRKFTNGSSITVGRHRSVDFQLNYDNISRRHAEISIEVDGQVFVQDLNSLNGTYINGQRVSFELLDNPATDSLHLCGPSSHKLELVPLDLDDGDRSAGVNRKYALTYIVQ